MKKLAVIGAGGHGAVVAEVAQLNGWEIDFFDDGCEPSRRVGPWQVIGSTKDLCQNFKSMYKYCFVAIGNNSIRMEKQLCLEKEGFVCPTLIHPSAVISQNSEVLNGTVIMANAVVNVFSKIGKGCIVNTASTIDHECILEDGVHISPGVNLAGNVILKERCWIGIGSSVKNGVEIGRNSIVGAGAVVLSSVENNKTVVGVPAKNMRVKNDK